MLEKEGRIAFRRHLDLVYSFHDVHLLCPLAENAGLPILPPDLLLATVVIGDAKSRRSATSDQKENNEGRQQNPGAKHR